MTRTVFWAWALSICAALIQSTLLTRIAIFHTIPDLTLIILIYISYINGTMTGQTLGFISGLTLDFISAAPLGFNALIRTIIGATAGLLKGTFFLDIVILPIALIIVGTLLKVMLVIFVHFLFAGAVPAYDLRIPMFWIELAYNVVLAPFLFAFLNLFRSVLNPRKEN